MQECTYGDKFVSTEISLEHAVAAPPAAMQGKREAQNLHILCLSSEMACRRDFGRHSTSVGGGRINVPP